MRSYLVSLTTLGLVGALFGAAVGLSEWSPLWPRLSLLLVVRGIALGWLVGAVLSPVIGRLLARRARGSHDRPRSRWRRAARGALVLAGIAPALLWLAAIAPNGVIRKAVPGGRWPGDARPNVVLITIDALRADHVGVYGEVAGLTPNIDAFAAEATRYDAAYAPSPWTLPSFGSIFTAVPPSECGLKTALVELTDWYIWEAKLADGPPVVAELLRRAGYTTAAVITNPFLAAERGFGRGFEHFRNEDGSELGSLFTRADAVTENALSWLGMNRHRPFFLWLHYMEPHVPYNSPETPPELRAQYPRQWLTRRLHWYGEMRHADDETKTRYQEFCRVMYREEVRYADKWVGRLLDELRKAGMYEDSLVVITSDHGEELFDHGEFEHGHAMHEEVLWVPLLVKWPTGWAADERVMQTVGLTELAPTFLEVAGVSTSGMSGKPLPRREGDGGAEVYSEGMFYGSEQTALTTDGYKLIYRPHEEPGALRFEVYDRRRDRDERQDLGGTGVAAGLREGLVKRTEAAQEAAERWKPRGEKEFEVIDLSAQSKRRLRALGYLAD